LKPSTIAAPANEPVFVIGMGQKIDNTVLHDGEMPLLGKILRLRNPLPPYGIGLPIVNSAGELLGVTASAQAKRTGVGLSNEILDRLTVVPATTVSDWRRINLNWRESQGGQYASGVQHALSEDHEAALTSFKGAFAGNPRNYRAAYYMGRTYRKLKQYGEAIAMYQVALRLNLDLVEAYSGMGLAYERLGQNENAIAAFKKAIELRPLDEDTYLDLARVYESRRHHKEIIDIFKKLAILKPESVDAYLSLGWSYAKLRQHALSKGVFQGVRNQSGFG
jgi:Tfp pilus assembly protein PilF